tara:strand:+ start:1279 stop:1905 length:627 start_codon:yes stop_codon:yes gene_type:complete
MRRLVALLLVSILSLSVSGAGESGRNSGLEWEETEEVGISLYHTGMNWRGSTTPYHSDPLDARESFEMMVWVENERNITSVEWVTQVCINTGVCFAPEIHEMAKVDDDGNYSEYRYEIDIDNTASYINWKYFLHYQNDSQRDIPAEGFGWKVWSNCWWDNGTWGGSSTHCQEEVESFNLNFSYWYAMMVLPVVAVVISMVALKEARRD